ncbi:hypothetical protein DMB90_20565 [Raoultella planticola]|uniref:Uncharacterized protein n=1 Tax=Raoultella planticola TaxID=575 RepID=A0A5P6AAK2_RAOPL|nr:hypothetical protein DMB90_20565 [Raoultella planticola]
MVFAIRDGLNHRFGDANYDIKQLALECASKRMYPDILNYDQVVKVTGSFKTPMAAAASSASMKKMASRSTTAATISA